MWRLILGPQPVFMPSLPPPLLSSALWHFSARIEVTAHFFLQPLFITRVIHFGLDKQAATFGEETATPRWEMSSLKKKVGNPGVNNRPVKESQKGRVWLWAASCFLSACLLGSSLCSWASVFHCKCQRCSPLMKCKALNVVTAPSLCSTKTSPNQLKQMELNFHPIITLVLCRNAAVGRNLRHKERIGYYFT